MRKQHWPALLMMVIATSITGNVSAADLYDKGTTDFKPLALPTPAEVQSLEVTPTKVTLIGLDDAAQIVLSGKLKTGRLQDLTGNVKYAVADSKVVEVTNSGRIIPLTNGITDITATYGTHSIKVNVTTQSCDVNLPINFANEIVPIFTKLGCNSGGCHGKASGQNGFKISLLGFEPDVDYMALVKEARGRRLFPAAPDRSLLLMKATGEMAHGGGKRMESDSDEYRLIRRWIASGTPYGKPDDPKVVKITVTPPHRTMTRHNKQQFSVHAHYSDGRVQDITRRAQYESNDTEIAVVDSSALVRTLDMSGEAAIMVRYQEHVNVFRATVPLGMDIPEYPFPTQTVVDTHTLNKWKALGLVPSKLSSDQEFIRRVSLDITGSLPSPKQVREFVESKDPKKRDKLVDTLVDSTEYSYYFASKWADILRVKRGRQADRAQGTFSFHEWIRQSIASDKSYDQFAAEILTANGNEVNSPPTVWYKDLQRPEQFVDDTAQVFLGLRLACAQCHHHPYEKWGQDDYWGLAAFFGRIGRKNLTVPSTINNRRVQRQTIYTRFSGSVTNKRTNKASEYKPLDAEAVKVENGDDPREHLVDWMTDPKNPFFAKALVNRYWAHFFGRGIVDPLDDMRITNPPSNPALLDALAADFVKNKFSLKELVKTICKSRTYQLSSMPNEFNKHDKQNYARYYPKRMSAEVLFDAVCKVTKSRTFFNGLPRDTHAPNRAIMLPDESFASYFLDVFGRPQRISACECERVSEANLAQSLHLLNSDEIQQKLSAGGARADVIAKDPRPDEQKVEELFVWAFAHKPNDAQMNAALSHIAKHQTNKKVAYENILWALINTKEFVFVK